VAETTDDLRGLLSNPVESLDLELKAWIDPSTPEGKAKIVKGCIALRNNDGGRLVIGISDNGTPDIGNAPINVRDRFHVDVIQGIVSAHSAELFPIAVAFPELDGKPYPVITVPPGVRTPVAAKKPLKDSDNKTDLVKANAVYVRSLSANNTVSSCEARHNDWAEITRICFNNREADIGGFVRRHLAALDLQSLAALLPVFAGVVRQPTVMERVTEELNCGRTRFEAASSRRDFRIPQIGYRESVILVDGEIQNGHPLSQFRDRVLRNAPQHSGWSPWVDLSSAQDHSVRPYVFENGWEALVAYLDPNTAIFTPSVDFWRIEPRGWFYQICGLKDDLFPRLTPRTVLDFLIQISRTAEVMSIGLSFARSLGCDPTKTVLQFGFRWSRLQGRRLVSWAEPGRMLHTQDTSSQDVIVTSVTVPLDTPPTGIAPHVENAVRDLFALFGGMQFESRVITDIVNKTLGR
jgi:Putative DNA-binding domain